MDPDVYSFDEEALIRDAFAAWAAVANVDFIQVQDGGAAAGVERQADIRIFLAPVNSGFAGWAYFPSGSAIGGDTVWNSNDNFSSNEFLTLAMHELGHSIGLEHTTGFHIMNPILPDRTTLSSHDIQGARQIYGNDQNVPLVYQMQSWDQPFILEYSPDDISIIGTSGNNVIETDAGVQTVSGAQGNDSISTGAANDLIYGGSGVDTMEGGTGDDTYHVDTSSDRVIENDGQGHDLVVASASYALRDHSQHVEDLELSGTGNTNGIGNGRQNVITGNSGNNTLNGAWWNDVLYGGDGDDVFDDDQGADMMYGGRGDDTYYVDHVGDRIFEEVGEGQDVVFSSVSISLRSNSQNLFDLTLTGSNDIFGIGNWQNNTITGNSGNNELNGAFGNDVLYGGDGNDTFRDDQGADMMYGGRGDDMYFVDNAGDRIFEDPGQGDDNVSSSVSFSLRDNSQHLFDLTLTGSGDIDATGNWQNNTLTGNAGSNTLDGAWGNDVLEGGADSDTFLFAASPGAANADQVMDFMPGTDVVALSSSIFTALSPGALPSGMLVLGTAALDSDDHLIYDGSTANLFYDADGNGAGAAELIATLIGIPSVTESDFLVV